MLLLAAGSRRGLQAARWALPAAATAAGTLLGSAGELRAAARGYHATAPAAEALAAASRDARQPSGSWCSAQAAQAASWRRELLPPFRGLLVDAAGTLLSPREPAAEVYLRYAQKYGCNLSPDEVLQRFRQAYNTPWSGSKIRYVGDGRPFWRHIVFESTGCCNEEMFEALYDYYARGDAYVITPGAVESLRRIRAAGLKTAVVSNFDTRLWRILRELGIDDLFDAVVISAELGAEKPNPVIFEAACNALGLPPEQCVHVGDDRRNDVYGARDSGCFAWLWGQDVFSFSEVEKRLSTKNYLDSLTDV